MGRPLHPLFLLFAAWTAGSAVAPSAISATPPDTIVRTTAPPRAITAQEATDPGRSGPRRTRYRAGVTLGGTALAGLTFEVRRGGWAAETTIGSFTLRDLSVALTAKRYFSGRTFQPFVGIGVWAVGASTEEGRGGAVVARLPVGLHWRFVRRHGIGVEVAVNRALRVNRLDPEDDAPPRTALIPIPSFYYRYGDN